MNMNEPKLRFKADDGSQFPDWEEKKLGDITSQYKVRNKKRLPLEIYSVNNIVGFIPQSEQFDDAGYLKDTDTSIYMIVPPKHFAYNPARLDVGSIGYQYLDRDVQVSSLYEVFETSNLVNDEFLWSWFHTQLFNNVVKRLQEGGVRLYFYYDKMQEVKIELPSLPEQQKIAEFLSTIDTVIAKQKETVSAWEERKKGVMQKLFSQEVRFKADDGSDFPEWEEKKLGEVMSVKDVKQIPTEEAPLMAFIAYQGVAEKGDRYDRSFLVKSDDKKYKRTDFNDFIYSSNNLDVGSIGLNKYGSAVISVVYEIFTFKDGFNPDCMNLLIQQPRIMSSIIRYRQGCLYGQYKIHSRDFLNVLISVPCLAEQQKIADCLSSLDEVIEKQKATLAAWEELKKGLLQQMFV